MAAPLTAEGVARHILTRFAALRRGERVLILAETETPATVKSAFFRAARQLAGENVSIATYDRKPAYTPPPEPLPHAVLHADLVICLDIYLSHTTLDVSARAEGARLLNLHPARLSVLRRAVLEVDYAQIRRRGRKLAAIVADAREGLIESGGDGRLSFAIDGDSAVSVGDGFARERGLYATLPNGKVKAPVVRDSINGSFVVNGVIIPPLNELSELVTLKFRHGRVVDVGGKRQARRYRTFLDSFDDPGMYVFDHLTFGFNPRATLRQPAAPAFSSEAEKVMACVNIGLGRAGLKGAQHTDVVSTGATLSLDGRKIMAGSRYLIW
jgi:leucyl aminopeptidase (aminopeptidase T)